MRVLHAVTQREMFVASGIYKHTRGGVPVNGVEHFSIHALPDGSWFTRIDYDWRADDSTSQLIEALFDPQSEGGKLQRVAAQLHSPAGIARETVDFHPAHALIGVSSRAGVRRDFEISLPSGYAVLLLKTTLAGIAAARWPAAGGQHISAFCGYRGGEDKTLIFDAVLNELPREDITIGGKIISTRVVALTGEFSQTFWLDPATGIALRRVMGDVVADLYNYAHRVEFGA